MTRFLISADDTNLCSHDYGGDGLCPICGEFDDGVSADHIIYFACRKHRMLWFEQWGRSIESDGPEVWETFKGFTKVDPPYSPPRICIRPFQETRCGDRLSCAICGEEFKRPPVGVVGNTFGAFVEGIENPHESRVCPECVRRFSRSLQPILEMKMTGDETSGHDGNASD